MLGLLWKRGPCTAYAVRRGLARSPSSHWSGSAGAVYPLLERLEARGLVRSRRADTGDREGWSCALTPAGKRAFLAWLGPPFGPEVLALQADPLRTRAHFLGALTARRRAAFFAQARLQLERVLAELRAWRKGDEFDRASLRAAIRVTRARRAWLDEAERALRRGSGA